MACRHAVPLSAYKVGDTLYGKPRSLPLSSLLGPYFLFFACLPLSRVPFSGRCTPALVLKLARPSFLRTWKVMAIVLITPCHSFISLEVEGRLWPSSIISPLVFIYLPTGIPLPPSSAEGRSWPSSYICPSSSQPFPSYSSPLGIGNYPCYPFCYLRCVICCQQLVRAALPSTLPTPARVVQLAAWLAYS